MIYFKITSNKRPGYDALCQNLCKFWNLQQWNLTLNSHEIFQQILLKLILLSPPEEPLDSCGTKRPKGASATAIWNCYALCILVQVNVEVKSASVFFWFWVQKLKNDFNSIAGSKMTTLFSLSHPALQQAPYYPHRAHIGETWNLWYRRH